MLHWGWFVLLLQTLGLGLRYQGLGLGTNGLINITVRWTPWQIQQRRVSSSPSLIWSLTLSVWRRICFVVNGSLRKLITWFEDSRYLWFQQRCWLSNVHGYTRLHTPQCCDEFIKHAKCFRFRHYARKSVINFHGTHRLDLFLWQ